MSTKSLQKNAIYFGVIFISLVVSYQYFHAVQVKYLSVTNYKECVDAGFKVLPTYPEKCTMVGKSFINPNQKKSDEMPPAVTAENTYKHQTYLIDGEEVQFRNGIGFLSPNQLLKQGTTTLEIIDAPFLYDINDDKVPDTTFLLRTVGTANHMSSFYIASLISLRNGFNGVNALYLDQNIESSMFVYKNGEISVGYTTSDATSTVKQKYFILSDSILKQVLHK